MDGYVTKPIRVKELCAEFDRVLLDRFCAFGKPADHTEARGVQRISLREESRTCQTA